MGQPRPLFCLFSVFSNKQYNFYNKYMWKNVHPVYSAGIQTHKLLWHESLPITTRPRLPPKLIQVFVTSLLTLLFTKRQTTNYSTYVYFRRTAGLSSKWSCIAWWIACFKSINKIFLSLWWTGSKLGNKLLMWISLIIQYPMLKQLLK